MTKNNLLSKNFEYHRNQLFDEKVSPTICHEINEKCNLSKRMDEFRNDLNSSKRHYLSALGLRTGFDGLPITDNTASYLFVQPKNYITKNGDQIVVWLYRENMSDDFRARGLMIGTMNDLETFIANRNMCSIGVLKFDNWQRMQEFIKDLQARILPTDENNVEDSLQTLSNTFQKHSQILKKSIDNRVIIDSHLTSNKGWIIKIKGFLSQLREKAIITTPQVTIQPLQKRVKKTNNK